MTTLDEIKDRAKKATPGPWHSDRGGDFQSITLHGGSLWIDVVDGSHQTPPHGEWIDSPDIDFIEHARTDIPRLLAALDAVLTFHRERYEPAFITTTCDYDGNEWPCEVVREITKALDGGAA